jgi:hypothetical protein
MRHSTFPHTRIARRAFALVIALPWAGSAFAQQAPPAPAAISAPALQREILSALSGETEIRPGVKLADRFTAENRQEARTYLAALFTRLGLEPKKQDYSADGENVYAVLSCGRPSAETIIVGAHYDSVRNAPGANDDASGVALVAAVALEMTRTTARTRDIMFVFFDQEERGLVGARAFAQMLKDENRPVHSVHTIDQMGWDSNGNRAVEIELPYEGALELYRKVSNGLQPPIQLFTTTETGSDHQAFRRLGFKAVGVTEEYHHGDTTPFYHKPGDTFATINFDYLTSTTKLVVEVMKTLTK